MMIFKIYENFIQHGGLHENHDFVALILVLHWLLLWLCALALTLILALALALALPCALALVLGW